MAESYIVHEGNKVPIKAIYVGSNGHPVEVWDKEHGVLDEELYDAFVRGVLRSG